MTPAARVAALTPPRNARLLDCTGGTRLSDGNVGPKGYKERIVEKCANFYHRRGELRKKNWEHGLDIVQSVFPTRLRFFAFGLTSTLPLCGGLGFRLRLRSLRLRLGLRLWLSDAFTSRLLLLLLSRRTLGLRRLTSFLTTIRLLHNLPLWRRLSLRCGLSSFLTTVHTRLFGRLSLWRGLPSFLTTIHPRLFDYLPLTCGLFSLLTAVGFHGALLRLCRSLLGLRGSTVRPLGISTSAFVLHVELLTLASIRHCLDTKRSSQFRPERCAHRRDACNHRRVVQLLGNTRRNVLLASTPC